MPKILVTGGTGYIGSHTVVELINKGYDVVIIDNLFNSTINVLEGIKKITGTKPEFHKFNLSNIVFTNNFFKDNKGIDAIIHFAAFKAVGESVNNPLKYYGNNIMSLNNIMAGMKDYNISNLVFSSSCTVYGQPEEKHLPVTETAPLQKANSPYGNTKQIAEDIIGDVLNAENNLKCIALRYFNPIGAHESAEIGELPIGTPSNLVPFITQTAIGLRDELSIFGKDYNTPDGTAIRDYINVVDLAKAHVIAIERLVNNKNKKPLELFNLGTGKGVSVLEAVKSFEKVSGVNLNYKLVERRPGDIEKVWADTKFANNELGWKAEKTLDETMLSAWKWEQKLRN